MKRIDRIASFRPGIQNGQGYSVEDLRNAADNFQRFSIGENPWYRPYVSINHDDGLACGSLDGASLEGVILWLDAAEVPDEVASWVETSQLQAPSIEFFFPKLDPQTGQAIDGFRDQDGNIVMTPVIKALTLLGNQPPAVKGLPPLKDAIIREHRERTRSVPTRSFSATTYKRPTVDRAAIIEALRQAGVDVSTITEAVPDPVLQAFLEFVQKCTKTSDPASMDMRAKVFRSFADSMSDPAQKKCFGDMLPPDLRSAAGFGDAEPVPVSVPSVGGGAQPSAITLKFADQSSAAAFQQYQAQQTAILSEIRNTVKAGNERYSAEVARFREAKVKAFREEMTKPDAQGGVRMTPVAFDAIQPMLLKCDNAATRRFADGKSEGTELDEAIAGIRAANSIPVRTFSQKLADPAKTNGVGPERRKQLLSQTPEGRAVLKREETAAKK